MTNVTLKLDADLLREARVVARVRSTRAPERSWRSCGRPGRVVVSSRAAIDAAFCRAVRTTFVGSITPALTSA
jgi:hypothetical protein